MRAMTAIAIRFIQHYKAILNASPGSCRLNERSAKVTALDAPNVGCARIALQPTSLVRQTRKKTQA